MSNDIVNIEYYYDEATKAYLARNYELAANLFRNCFEIYEDAELPVFDSRIKEIGEDAFIKYNQIVANYLYGSGFDEIEYGC